MSVQSILVVEDRPQEREALVRMLRMAQYNVIAAENPETAIGHIDEPIDLVLSDLKMGAYGGLDLLRAWKERHPEIPFILITAYADVDSAVEAMKRGAVDYMTKPVDPERLLSLIRKWIQSAQLAAQRAAAGTNGHGGGGIPDGASLEELERIAVEKALEQHHGNRTHAAKTLGISVRTLQRKLKAWRGPLMALQTHLPNHEMFVSHH